MANSNHVLRTIVSYMVPDRADKIMACVAQCRNSEEVNTGLAFGLALGLQSGGAQILTQCLEKRFGPLPEEFQQRITSASMSKLEFWADRAVDAPDLQSVFGPIRCADDPRRKPFWAEIKRLVLEEAIRRYRESGLQEMEALGDKAVGRPH